MYRHDSILSGTSVGRGLGQKGRVRWNLIVDFGPVIPDVCTHNLDCSIDDIVVAVEDLVGDGNIIAPEAVVAGNDYREVAHILMRGADVAFLFSFFGFSRSGTT